MTDNRWNGLVLDDYRVVLPLPIVRSWGRFTQVQRAAFTQQSGPFGQLRPGDLKALLTSLPRSVLSLNLPLKTDLLTAEIPANFLIRTRTNLTLDLSPDYPTLVQGFSKTLRKKLRRYPKARLSPTDADTVIDVYRGSSGKKAGLKPTHYQRIQTLMAACRAHHAGYLYRLDDERGLLAAGFFPIWRGRVINLFAGSTHEGFRADGMARLLAAVIQQHQGKENIFDFEGSEIPGVHDFFLSFGPVNTPYLNVKRKGLLG